MANRALSFVDRLAERGLVDRWGFLGFAAGGALAIIFAKALQAPAGAVALGAMAVIIAYAVIVQRSGTGKLRGDQAGDNCYYLGLIFTLVSLGYTIFVFDPSDTATTIVQGFGIALASTIIGLILRVYFNQSRVDLVQTEDTARLELAEAAGKLKAELSRITVSMNDFGRQTRQSLDELRDEVVKTLKEAQDAAGSTIAEAAKVSSAALTEQSAEVASRSKKLSTATDKIVDNIERHAAAMTEIENSSRGIASGLAALEQAAETTRISMEQLTAQATGLSGLQEGVQGTTLAFSDTVSQLLAQIRSLDETTARVDKMIIARLEDVRAVPAEIATAAIAAIEAAVAHLGSTLGRLADAQDELAAKLSAGAGETVELAARHNAALERELSKSRENVAKVHTALVDMTGRLADRVEGKVA